MNTISDLSTRWRPARRPLAVLGLLLLTLVVGQTAHAQGLEGSAARHLDTPADPVLLAVDEYRRTGNARTVSQSSFVAYPYGHSQPTLTCAPLRACVIELEPGEILMAVIAGDTERWIISEAYSGVDGDTPLVVVKPTTWDLTTNLVISTDRRIYELTLDALPSAKTNTTSNPQQDYTRRLRFYYPDDMVRTFREREQRAERVAEAALKQSIPVMNPDFRLENLNFNYKWLRTKDFPFELEQVFDDGAHVYLKVPTSAQHEVAPVLFVTENGERQILNYVVRAFGDGGSYYITDRVFKQGVLVVGRRDTNWLGRPKHREERLTVINLRGR